MAAPNVLSPDSTIHKRLPSRHRLVSALHKSHGGIPLSDAPLVRQNVSLRTCRNKPLSNRHAARRHLARPRRNVPFRPGSREGEVVESTLVLVPARSQIDCSLLPILVVPSHRSPFVPHRVQALVEMLTAHSQLRRQCPRSTCSVFVPFPATSSAPCSTPVSHPDTCRWMPTMSPTNRHTL